MTAKEFRDFRDKVIAKMQFASAQEIARTASVHVCGDHCNIPGSASAHCRDCGRIVWFKDLQHAHLPKVCLLCATKLPDYGKADFVAQRGSVWDRHHN
jgi:hypothetical protein